MRRWKVKCWKEECTSNDETDASNCEFSVDVYHQRFRRNQLTRTPRMSAVLDALTAISMASEEIRPAANIGIERAGGNPQTSITRERLGGSTK
jgi:hypothetical protein